MKFIKKNWFIIAIVILSLARFIFTYNLPNFYLENMGYDDYLMIYQSKKLRLKRYLGFYQKTTLVKGMFFPYLLFLTRLYKISPSVTFTLLYIGASLFFVLSLKNVIKNKKFLIAIYAFLLFNPATYSQDIFQRVYRNSISFAELLFFLGAIVRILFSKDRKIINYILFGISLALLFLTREDNLWTYPVIAFVAVYSIIKDHKIRNIIYNVIPIAILIASLNVISYMNYKHYGIYTYNELQKSEFHNTYKKILQIKDDEKIDKVAIPKSTFYKLIDNVESFEITREELDRWYDILEDFDGEIYNGNIVWYFRDMVFVKMKFKTAKESEEYYKKLGEEIDERFKDGTFEKEFVMPSIFMATPTTKDLKKIPGYLIYTIGYTATYKDIKTMNKDHIKKNDYEYDKTIGSYYFVYDDYHHTVNIVDKNPMPYELIRIIYMILTVLFGIIALLIYLRNIFKWDSISILSHILVICYGLIIGGTVYTHITSFHAIRPIYLGNIYIIQTIFILINIYRIDIEKIKNKIKIKKCKVEKQSV